MNRTNADHWLRRPGWLQLPDIAWAAHVPSYAGLLVGIISFVVIVLGLIALQSQRVGQANREVLATQQRMEGLRFLERGLLDAGIGQRGFLVTGDKRHLDLYHAALRQIPDQLTALRSAWAGNAEQLAHLSRLENLWQGKIAAMRDTIFMRQLGFDDQARLRAASDVGTNYLKAIREEIGNMLTAEQGLFRRRSGELQTSEQVSAWLIVLAIGIAISGLGIAIYRLQQRNRRLAAEARLHSQSASNLKMEWLALQREIVEERSRSSATTRQLATTLESAPIFLFGQDRDLRYHWFRGNALGHDADWFIGKTDYDILPDHRRARVVDNKEAVIATGEPRQYQLMIDEGDQPQWYDVRLLATHNLAGDVDGLEGIAINITDRMHHEQHVRLLMRELVHRSKNILAVVQAIARQTMSNATDPAAFLGSFSERLDALSASHALLVAEHWTGTDIGALVRAQLGHLGDTIGNQVHIDGPDLTLPPNMVQNIGLALYELATNAAKYGALSTPEGNVRISWKVAPSPDGRSPKGELPEEGPPEGGSTVEISWIESNGPPVTPPTHSGFGRHVIERAVARAVAGKVTLAYPTAGFQWTLTFDLPGVDVQAPQLAA